jgi:fluoroacetyl-CoA thioesterase
MIMIMIMENAALNAIRAYLDLGESAVGTAVLGRGGLAADERLARVERARLEAGVDDRAVLRRVAYYGRPDEKTRLEGLVSAPS